MKPVKEPDREPYSCMVNHFHEAEFHLLSDMSENALCQGLNYAQTLACLSVQTKREFAQRLLRLQEWGTEVEYDTVRQKLRNIIFCAAFWFELFLVTMRAQDSTVM